MWAIKLRPLMTTITLLGDKIPKRTKYDIKKYSK